MKKLLLSLSLSLSLFSSLSFAIDPYTVLINQVDPTGSYQQTRFLMRPAADSYIKYDRSTDLFDWDSISNVTMSSTQIGDTSAVGRGVMTAANQAAARSAIGAGTSNFDGDYNSLTNRITNNTQLTNGAGFITAATAPVTSVNGQTGSVTLSAANVGAAATSHTHTSSNISDSTSPGRAILTAASVGAIQSLLSIPTSITQLATGASSQVILGNGTYATLASPTVYSGTTNGSGVYAVTYPSAYSTKPKLVFAVEGGTNKDTSVLTSTTTTGFSITVERRTDIAGLLPTYAAVSGITVNVSVYP